MKKVVRKIEGYSRLPNTVLILGESGVGKELAAEMLHGLSDRATGPLVRVNCGAIPESLIESELFGYERGAFTGATGMHRGYFEQAHRGTIFLDEVGELPHSAQVKLLRVLENHEIRRIGSERTITLDFRVIAATNRDLRQMVNEKTFREDLYYRLNTLRIELPPLRKRPKDIAVLAEYFYRAMVKKLKPEDAPNLSTAELHTLLEHDWPGNVRQLRSFIERAFADACAEKSDSIHFVYTEDEPLLSGQRSSLDPASNSPKSTTKEEILEALEKSGGRIQGERGAAKLLGLNPGTLRSRMLVLGIPLPRQRKRAAPD